MTAGEFWTTWLTAWMLLVAAGVTVWAAIDCVRTRRRRRAESRRRHPAGSALTVRPTPAHMHPLASPPRLAGGPLPHFPRHRAGRP